jgi:hypothetical protein
MAHKTIRARECWECGRLFAVRKKEDVLLDSVWRLAWERYNAFLARVREGGSDAKSLAAAWAEAFEAAKREVGVEIESAGRFYCGC